MTAVDISRWLHILGLVMAALGVGVLAVYFNSEAAKPGLRKLGFSLHGAGLLILILAGFAMLGQKGYMSPFPVWAMAKLVLWLLLGSITVLAKRTRNVALVIAVFILIAGTAAYLGVMPKI